MSLPWIRPVTLVYHGVNQVAPSDDPSRLIVSPENLLAHIALLQRLGYGFESASELAARGRPKRRTAVITFDDGWADALDTAELLSSRGIVASFFVCPGWWGEQHPDVPGQAGRLLDADQAHELVTLGMDLGSHAMSHPDLRTLDDDDLRDELTASKRAVEDVSGRACTTLAYPYGLYDRRVMDAAEAAGYKLAFAWLPGPWEPFAAPRLPAPPRHGAGRLALKLLGLRRRRP